MYKHISFFSWSPLLREEKKTLESKKTQEKITFKSPKSIDQFYCALSISVLVQLIFF
jgi:hypothetical protein